MQRSSRMELRNVADLREQGNWGVHNLSKIYLSPFLVSYMAFLSVRYVSFYDEYLDLLGENK